MGERNSARLLWGKYAVENFGNGFSQYADSRLIGDCLKLFRKAFHTRRRFRIGIFICSDPKLYSTTKFLVLELKIGLNKFKMTVAVHRFIFIRIQRSKRIFGVR